MLRLGFVGDSPQLLDTLDVPALLKHFEAPIKTPESQSPQDAKRAVKGVERPQHCIIVRESKSGNLSLARKLRTLTAFADVAVLQLGACLSASEVVWQGLQRIAAQLKLEEIPYVAHLLQRYTVTVAMLNSVARYDGLPAPSILAHAASPLPGIWFDLQQGSPIHFGGVAGWNRLISPGIFGTMLAYGIKPNLLAQIMEPLPQQTVILDPSCTSSRDYWGASRWAEYSCLTVPPEQILTQIAAPSLERCSHCGALCVEHICLFCGIKSRRGRVGQ